MLVSQLIKQLEYYRPDDELYVEYWDKVTVEAMEEVTLTDEEWSDVVIQMEDAETYPATQEAFGMFIEEMRNK